MKRRTLLKSLLAAPAAATLAPPPVAASPVPAETPPLETSAPGAAAASMVSFFTAAQLAALGRLSELIMPASPTHPGARESGVPEFLDFLISQSPAARQALYRNGLDRLNALAAGAHAVPSEELAQSGVRRETVPGSSGGARRTLCAFEKLSDGQASAILAPLHERWTYSGPRDEFARFLEAAKADVVEATRNSRQWRAAEASLRGHSAGTGVYWRRVE